MVNTIKNNSRQIRYHRSCIAGFTLIEVIIIVTLMGILSAIAYPTIGKWVPNYRLKAATQILYANFQKAKIHAVKTNNEVTFNFTAVADCSTPTGYTFTDEDGVVVVSEILKNGVCLYDSTFDNADGFDPRGLGLGLPLPPPDDKTLGSVKLKNTKITRTYEITQGLAGSVKIE